MNNYIHARRLRNSAIIREALDDVKVEPKNLIMPIFLVHGSNVKEEISSLPNIYHFSIDKALEEIQHYVDVGINKLLVFGIPATKDEFGTSAADPEEIVSAGIRAIKEKFQDSLVIFADVCLCAYTTHGHCGIPDKNGFIQNEISLKYISEAALSYAQAGADFVAPSDMMDGRIQSIRKILDENNLVATGILSYAVKFASAYYGPFREAEQSAPQFGDRKSYQLSPNNSRIALREIELDEAEEADMVMVKPALAYLDILYQAKQMTKLPMVAYNVSGEYSQVKFAGKAGVIDEDKVALENLYAMKRAGADLIITYHAVELAEKGLLK